jgi:hypothetical protein
MECLGICEYKEQRICINIEKHKSDAEVRSTLLHEMCHAGSPNPNWHEEDADHGSSFWCQIESLLRQRAPIKVDSGELAGRWASPDVIPKRFPLSRKAIAKIEEKNNRLFLEMEKERELKIPCQEIDEEAIAFEFADAAYQFTWKNALRTIGRDYGLLNTDGKPTSEFSKRAIEAGRKKFAEARKLYLMTQRASAERASVN